MLFLMSTNALISLTTSGSISILHSLGLQKEYIQNLSLLSLILMYCAIIMTGYLKYKNNNAFLSRLTSTPVLVFIICAGRLADLRLNSALMALPDTDLYIFQFMYPNSYFATGLTIIIASCFLSYKFHRQTKIKIAS